MAKKLSEYRVRGLVAAVFTPMTETGDINLAVIPEYAKYLLENNVKGVFVNGTTGEFASLSVAERNQLVEAWAAGGKHGLDHLMVHVGAPCLKDAMDMAAHAEKNGADAVGMISPSFFKPPDMDVLMEYSKQVASAAPNTPFYYYHLPQMTGVHLDMQEYMRRAEKEIPTFRGIKYSGLDLAEANQCLVYGDSKYNILWGADQQLLGALAMGLDAAIGSTYNYLAPVFNVLLEAFARHDLESARREMIKVQTVINIAFSIGTKGVSSQKAVMNISTPVNVGPPRLPIPRATHDVMRKLEAALVDGS